MTQIVSLTRRLSTPIAAVLLCAAVEGQTTTARRDEPPPAFKQYFKKFSEGRAIPSDLLAEHGIDDQAIGRSYALVAGISKYSRLPTDKQSLPPAKVDVDKLVDFLLNKEYFDEVVVLEDDAVTLENLNYFLGVYFPDRMGKDRNSRFLFAYSGHGFDDGDFSYILQASAESLTDRTHSIDLAQLKVAVEKSVAKALNSLVLINACQGGSFLDHIAFGDSRLIFPKIGAHAITAGARKQFTFGSGATGHGSYFFDDVLAGLDGRADSKDEGVITADQLFSYVRSQVQLDTQGAQDPQFGDIDPKTSQGSFFFLRRGRAALSPRQRDVGPTPVDACEGALAADYYSYAVDNGFQYDFIRWIDRLTWTRLQKLGRDPSSALFAGGRSFLGGSYSLADDYDGFDRKRTEHLRSIYYTRSRDQAFSVLQATAAARAFDSYSECLRQANSSTPQLAVWAAREDLQYIELHVRYLGPKNGDITATSALMGGDAAGALQGVLWSGGAHFSSVAPERVLTVTRRAEPMHVVVIPQDQPAIARTFVRADAVFTTMFSGAPESAEPAKAHTEAQTPDNNENRGACPNSVGRHDGKYCTSRTTLRLTTVAPKFFRNATLQCAGAGCPWTSSGPVEVSADGRTVTAYLDNWGLGVVATLAADEYERVSANQCGAPTSVAVLRDRPVLIGVRKECLSVASIKWVLLPTLAEGIFRFGDRSALPATVSMNGGLIDGGTGTIASYTLAMGAEAR